MSPRLIPLERLRDPDEPNPYEGYRSGINPEPPYDILIVGRGTRHAFKGGVPVDERTGEPLPVSPPPSPPPAAAPPRRKPGRPRKATKEEKANGA